MTSDEILKRLLDKAEKQTEDIAAIKVDLAGHIRRTTLLEARVLPLEGHVAGWAGAGKLFAVVCALGGLLVAVWKALG